MVEDLKHEFTSLVSEYANSNDCYVYYEELARAYNGNNRHYHNLNHIAHMLNLLNDVEAYVFDLDVLKLTIWYHDVVYSSRKNDNEEKSAELAKNRLNSINFDGNRVKIIQNLIISTKKHEVILTENDDNAFLLDIDLSILGSDWETYLEYSKKIRKEYAIYPNFMYKKGRKKVLSHFLEREHLYFTNYFRNKLENQAQENLKKELNML
ncbi:hypothetical protein [Winogradskyella sp. 3972H.M.0a.05]|uniref:HD domain-containing protein n=1 Tax=Winogradskyella sp. 3972H.M.0a.05 TaxID=2950277 RepID=UPI003396C1A7